MSPQPRPRPADDGARHPAPVAKGTPSIARSSAVMAAGTLVSRVLGFIRNALLISALGATASGAADAFNTANSLSTQLYNLLIGGILNAILVPQIVRALRQRNGDELVNRLLTAASALLAVVAAVLTAASPLVIMLYASGLEKWQPLAFAFAFWCMPQVFFYGLYALWGQVLNARSSFGPYMWSPVLNNLISIAALIAYLHVYGGYTSGQTPDIWTFNRIALIGATTTLGIVAQALVLYIPLVRSGFRPRFIWGVRGMGLGETSKVALWALLGVGIMSIGDWATTNLGSQAVTAAQSAEFAHTIVPSTTMYANAQLIYMLPQSLVTTSIITALFTRMSEKAAAGDATGVRDDLSLGLRSIAVFTVLTGFGIAVLGAPALQAFVPSLSTAEASAGAPMMTVLGVGVIVQGIWFTVQRVMLAYADTKRLIRGNIAVGATITAFCAGAFLLAPADQWMTWACAGIVCSHLAGTITVIPLLRRHLPDLDGARVLSTYARLLASIAPAVLVGMLVRRLLGPADGSMTGVRAGDALAGILLVALLMTVIYLVMARLLRVSELAVLYRPLSSIIIRVGSLLPGGLGRAVRRAGRALAPAAPARSVPPAPAPEADDAARPATSARPARTAQDAARLPDGAGTVPARMPVPTHARPRTGGVAGMSDPTPIGTGRYELTAPLSSVLPRTVRHSGRDTILDRDVTVLTVTDATPHRAEVLEAATRAVLVDDPRTQRVYDVEHGTPSFIVTEPTAPTSLAGLIRQGAGPEVLRAVVGEVAQALDACSRRGLHHLNLTPESVRVRPDGTVQVCGVGIEAAALGLEHGTQADPLAPDRTDAHALIELLYYGLTGRWPGKHPGIPAAPTTASGAPVAPSQLAMVGIPADLDALVARAWTSAAPTSAAEVAHALGSWDTSLIPATAPAQAAGATASRGPQAAGAVGAAAGLAAGAAGAVASRAGSLIGRLRRGGQDAATPVTGPTAPSAPVPGPAPAPGERLAAGSGATAAPGSAGGASPSPYEAHWAPSPGAAIAGRSSAVGTGAAAAGAAPASAATSSSGGSPAEDSEQDEERASVNRTTAVVLTAALVGLLVVAFLAISNILQLAGVRVSDPDVPAAKTVPTVAATAAPSAAGAAPTAAAPQTTAAAPITLKAAQSLDPFGDNNEHPELAGNLIDKNPTTIWYSRYYANSSLAWKQGLGVAVTLEQAADVSGITLQGTGTGGNVQIRATSPEDPTGGTLLAEGALTEGTTTFSFATTSASSIVVWYTQLPTASDGLLKATLSEITLQ